MIEIQPAGQLFDSSTALLEQPDQQFTEGQNDRTIGCRLNGAFANLYSRQQRKRSRVKRRALSPLVFSLAINECLHHHFHKLLQTHLKQKPQPKIVQVGCGSGKFCRTLAERGYQAYGVDHSHMLLKKAREIAPGCEFERASIYESCQDLFMQQFDAVVYLDCIDHLRSPQRFVQAAIKSLAPGGLLIVSGRYQRYLMNLPAALMGHNDSDPVLAGEMSRQPTSSLPVTLRQLLTNHGLEIVDSQGAGCIPGTWRSQLFVARKPHSSLPCSSDGRKSTESREERRG